MQKDQRFSKVDSGTTLVCKPTPRGEPIFTALHGFPQYGTRVIDSNITILSGPANIVDIIIPGQDHNALRL